MKSKLKKSTDRAKLKAAANEALAQKPAETPEASALKAKRGRQPGVTFPGGYKNKPKAAAAPGNDPHKPPQEPERPPAAAPGETAAGFDPTAMLGNIDVKDSIEMLSDAVFNKVLAVRRGPHWAMTPEEVKMLSGPISEIINEVLPNVVNNVWTYRLGAIAIVLGPRLMMEVVAHPDSKIAKLVNLITFGFFSDEPKSRPQDTDKANNPARPGISGEGQNDPLPAHSPAA